MIIRRTLLSIMTLFVVPAATLAQSANCGPHDVVVARLAEGYGESRQSIALGANNSVVEVFASSDSGSWTITVTAPGGPTCLVASGQAYQAVNEPLPTPEEEL
jgi:TRAP-type mannitol/chloroaromatic compound transport system substrate-binding protein